MEKFWVLGTVAACFAALLFSRKPPDLIFAGGLLLLLLTQSVSVETALSGFANPGLITIACLYIVAAAIRETQALKPLMNWVSSGKPSDRVSLFKFTFPTSLLSSLLNNTPIVAALIPEVNRWSKKLGKQPSQFLLPISYAAILGGTCTLIGTSTNLLVFGFVQQSSFADQLGFFDISLIGVPVTLAGLLYILIASRWLLPKRASSESTLRNTREYCVEMIVEDTASIVGKSIEQAGLRHLHGLYLIEVVRGNLVLAAVGPNTILEAGDRLVFSGLVNSISELLDIDGLTLAEEQVFKLSSDETSDSESQAARRFGQARLVEAVIGNNNPFIGKTIKQVKFRKHYNAAVIAVVRNGSRVMQKTGDIMIRPGDTLLMLARRSFTEQHRYSRDFLLVNGLEELSLDSNSKAPWCWLAIGSMVGLASFNIVPVVIAAMVASAIVLLSRCVTFDRAKQSLDLQVLLTIGLAFGIGGALTDSGAANMLATSVLSVFGQNPLALLVAVYLITVLLTEMVTNNAAAVISFSLVAGIVESLGYNLIPYAVVIMVAASASFISPMGYQTNLMVYSAGGYRFSDYLRFGLPLSLVVGVLTLVLVPIFWTLTL
ncbi:SLC13 family permease [Pleionea litopenaei]|uniref:SLC13 family permease n=1 Tax=Pleionea litopenaei TaxID=3070815 RepID=A0AA51RTP7_9GAMM|nr:SLC13 family permease [Pleionea sp. HL-JVS1]WMS87299.1 SLC13 family permease [Pleionea sp. HL-JVS1]